MWRMESYIWAGKPMQKNCCLLFFLESMVAIFLFFQFWVILNNLKNDLYPGLAACLLAVGSERILGLLRESLEWTSLVEENFELWSWICNHLVYATIITKDLKSPIISMHIVYHSSIWSYRPLVLLTEVNFCYCCEIMCEECDTLCQNIPGTFGFKANLTLNSMGLKLYMNQEE